jgi:hypothetical protein
MRKWMRHNGILLWRLCCFWRDDAQRGRLCNLRFRNCNDTVSQHRIDDLVSSAERAVRMLYRRIRCGTPHYCNEQRGF